VFIASPLGVFAGAVFTVLMALAAVLDVRTRRIPNRIVAVIAVIGFLYSALTPPSWMGALRGLGGFATGLACWLPFYAFSWLGAGDVKLFAAAGAWLGPMRTVEGSLISALLGAVLALLWMLRSRGLKNSVETLGIAATLPSVLAETSAVANKARSLPYGVAMAAGALCAAWVPGILFS
jgi:prepilin peptidase CpaA